MLSGYYGEPVALAMKIIVKVGEVLGAEKLIKVGHVHISGVSYSNIGEPGLRFMEKLLGPGPEVKVYTTVNPTCIDLGGGIDLFDKSLLPGQLRINKLLESIGVKPVYTCIPYVLRKPCPREHLAWGESNAVAVANSIYGAYTNREGGPLTIASAITGRTYYSGLHVLGNRVPRYMVSVEEPILDEAMASLLGLYIGEAVKDIPYLRYGGVAGLLQLKELLASAAASGSHGLIVIDGITPQGTYGMEERIEKLVVDWSVLRETYDRWSEPLELEGYTLAYIGCPHYSLNDIVHLVKMVSRYRRVRDNVFFLLTIPYSYYGSLDGYIDVLRSRGIHVAYGTCPIVSRFTRGFDKVLTNSGKVLFYLSRLHGLRVSLGSLKDIVEVVMEK